MNKRRNYSVVTTSTAKTATTLVVEKLDIDKLKIQESASSVRKKGNTFQVVQPEDSQQEKDMMTLVCCTHAVSTRKI